MQICLIDIMNFGSLNPYWFKTLDTVTDIKFLFFIFGELNKSTNQVLRSEKIKICRTFI